MVARAADADISKSVKSSAGDRTLPRNACFSHIVGKWSEADGAETIEYKADGTVTETLAGGDVMKGKYSFPDATHIKVELEGPMSAMGPIVSPFTIKCDTMDVTGVDGSSV